MDFLTKKKKKNEGEIPQYYVRNSHPPIIEPEVFDLVQAEIKKRQAIGYTQNSSNPFTNMIVCGNCGARFGSKIWHSNSKYRRTVWQCNSKYKGEEKCTTPHLYETAVQAAFIDAFNRLFNGRERLFDDYSEVLQALSDTSDLDKRTKLCQNELDAVSELIRKCVEENAHTALNQADYTLRESELFDRYEAIQTKLDKVNEERQSRSAKRENISRFMASLEQSESLLTEFDASLWCEIVESLTVFSANDMIVTFKDGSEIPVEVGEKQT